MATVYAVNHTKAYVDEPASKLDVRENHGRVRRHYDSYTLLGEASIGDFIEFGKLPKDAKVIDARVIGPSDGTTGQLDVGWKSNGTDAADQDGLFAGATEVDTGAGAVDSKMLATAAGYNKAFAAETTLIGEYVEATTASTGDVIQLEVFYVVD